MLALLVVAYTCALCTQIVYKIYCC